MTLFVYYGYIAAAFCLAAICCLPFKTRKNRLIAVSVCFLAAVFPCGKNGYSLAASCFALIDTVSISLLFGLGYWIVQSKSPFRLSEIMLFAFLGLALCITELGYISFDLYGWGYNYRFAACFVCLLILLFRFKAVCFILTGYLMFRIGIYVNIFDVFFDLILTVISWAYLLNCLLNFLFRGTSRKSSLSDIQPHVIEFSDSLGKGVGDSE